ncbi:MAG: hypothetical protein ACKVVP_19910 [Chloroflexota bacterium]
MALPNTASTEHWLDRAPQGELVDLVELCARLESRLHTEERQLSDARERGESTTSREATWIRMLHRYERLCDLLTPSVRMSPLPAA